MRPLAPRRACVAKVLRFLLVHVQDNIRYNFVFGNLGSQAAVDQHEAVWGCTNERGVGKSNSAEHATRRVRLSVALPSPFFGSCDKVYRRKSVFGSSFLVEVSTMEWVSILLLVLLTVSGLAASFTNCRHEDSSRVIPINWKGWFFLVLIPSLFTANWFVEENVDAKAELETEEHRKRLTAEIESLKVVSKRVEDISKKSSADLRDAKRSLVEQSETLETTSGDLAKLHKSAERSLTTLDASTKLQAQAVEMHLRDKHREAAL